MILSATCRYSQQHVHEFERKGAVKHFLDPIGLYDKPLTPEYSKNEDRLFAKEERDLFQAFHFVKFRLERARKDGKRLDFWYQMFTALRNRLVLANTGLIYDCIQKSARAGAYKDKTEFISAGSMTLIKSVENFNPWFNYRFSTYACRALLHQFSHVASRLSHPPTADITEVDAPDLSTINNNDVDLIIDRMQVALETAELTDQEREIVQMRFFDNSKLSEVGDRFGFTKERARQIQEIALGKIRKSLSSDKSFTELVAC